MRFNFGNFSMEVVDFADRGMQVLCYDKEGAPLPIAASFRGREHGPTVVHR